jgi:hypothetical protein
MAYVEFDGELDGAAPAKSGGGFVEFNGELDEQPGTLAKIANLASKPSPPQLAIEAVKSLDLAKIPDQLKSGVASMQSGFFANNAKNAGAFLNSMDRIDRGEKLPMDQDPLGYQDMSPDQRAKMRTMFDQNLGKNVTKAVQYHAEKQGYAKNESVAPFIESLNKKEFKQAWEVFKSDPVGIMQQMTVENAPNMIPAVGGGVAGVLLKGGVSGMMAGLATGSYPVEYIASITESLQNAGVDLNDTAAVEAKLRDPQFIKEAGQRAHTRGTVIAATDAASGGLMLPIKAGKSAVKAATKGMYNLGAEVGTEMAGEAAAQASTGEDIKLGDVIAEGMGAGPMAVATTMMKNATQPRAPTTTEVVQSIQSAQTVDQAIQAATAAVDAPVSRRSSYPDQDAIQALEKTAEGAALDVLSQEQPTVLTPQKASQEERIADVLAAGRAPAELAIPSPAPSPAPTGLIGTAAAQSLYESQQAAIRKRDNGELLNSMEAALIKMAPMESPVASKIAIETGYRTRGSQPSVSLEERPNATQPAATAVPSGVSAQPVANAAPVQSDTTAGRPVNAQPDPVGATNPAPAGPVAGQTAPVNDLAGKPQPALTKREVRYQATVKEYEAVATKELRAIARNSRSPAFRRDAAREVIQARDAETNAKRSEVAKKFYAKAKQIDPDRDSMAQAISKLGGISRDAAAGRLRLAPEELNRRGHGVLHMFHAKGRSLDEIGQQLAELGYVRMDENGKHDQADFEEKLAEAAGGNEILTPNAMMVRAEADRAAAMEEVGATSEQEYDEIEAYVDDMPDALQAAIDATFDADFTPNQVLSDEEIDRLLGGPETSGQSLESDPARAARESDQGSQAPADSAEDFALEGQTEAQAREQVEAEAERRRAEKANLERQLEEARKDRERRDIADRQEASAENFQLGQSAEESLSGQRDIFSDASPAEPATSKPSEIVDFGEKLEGARKFKTYSLSQELTDEALATEPLSKVWPADEWQNFEDDYVAAVAFTARAEVPAKPRVPYKVARWVEKVKTVRSLATMVADGTVTKEQFQEKLAKIRGLDGFAAKIRLLQAIPREHWNRIETVREYPDAYRFEGDRKVPTPLVAVYIDGKYSPIEGASNVTDALDRINELLGNEVQEKRMQFEVRGRPGSYFINKKGDKEYRHLKEFTDSKEALAYRDSNYNDLVAAWEDVKSRDNVKEKDVRNSENRPRTGSDRRKGKDVTPEMFQEAFGFRGGQFGNWVAQGTGAKDRQSMLNQAYDGLMDLADIVGIPPKAISLNGTLGISFGARGSGWASAHFEPSNLVINLTKTRGAGALAHEWFHALDNYFSRQRGGEVAFTGDQAAYRRNNFITYRPEPMMVHKSGRTTLTKAKLEAARALHPDSGFYSAENWEVDASHPQGVRPEVERAFAELVEALNASPMASRSRTIDKAADGYWSQIIEIGARSFENFVISKMMEKGYHNDYLANVKPVAEFPRSKERYPYLLVEEVAPIAEAFDELFGTIKSKETDKGVALFFRPGTNPEQFGLDTGVLPDPEALDPFTFKPVAPMSQDERQAAMAHVKNLNAALRRAGAQTVLPVMKAPTQNHALAQSIGKVFGTKVLFVTKNRTFQGVAHDGVAYITEDMHHPELAVAGHEVFHVLEESDPTAADALRDHVRAYLKDGVVKDRQQWEQLRSTEEVSERYAEGEVMADLNGAMWLDSKFWREMIQRDVNLFRRVAYLFMENATKLVKGLAGTRFDAEALVTDVDAVRKLIAQTWADRNQKRSGAKAKEDARFSKSDEQGPTFYSALAETIPEMSKIADKNGMVGSEQARLWLAARQKEGKFKAEELAWSGLDDFLKMQTGKVAVADIDAFVRENGVQVQEVMKENSKPEPEPEITADQVVVEPHGQYQWRLRAPDGSTVEVGKGVAESIEDAKNYGEGYFNSRIRDRNREQLANGDQTKYSNYVLPGGENYRELLLTLPNEAKPKDIRPPLQELPTGWVAVFDRTQPADKQWSMIPPGQAHARPYAGIRAANEEAARDQVLQVLNSERDNKDRDAVRERVYRSSHWDEKNIIAHIRFNDRTDADGKRVLFIEELQSDWGQQGKKGGFSVPTKVEIVEQSAPRNQYNPDGKPLYEVMVDGVSHGAFSSREVAEQRAASAPKEQGKTPAAPFVTDTKGWLSLGIKRMIRYAAENGYDKVAFINGEQSADRYDLSKQVDAVRIVPDGLDTWILSADKDGKSVLVEYKVPTAKIEDYIGKDVAQKLVAMEPDQFKARELSGAGLKVGGEGMKSFYDQIVPQVANDVLKKLGGGKVSSIVIKTGNAPDKVIAEYADQPDHPFTKAQRATVNGFDITQDLRAKAMAGMPLFSRNDDTAARNALKALSEHDEIFRLPKSAETDLESIAHDNIPGVDVKKMTNIPGETRYNFTLPDGRTARMMVRHNTGYRTSLYGFQLDDGEMHEAMDERPGRNAEAVEGKDDVWIDVSLLNEAGGFGAKMYNIAATYAHNNGMVFIGDPAGLSDEALRRRPEQMLSSALKFGTTAHLAPHPRQIKGDADLGVPGLDWVYGDHIGNIEKLIRVNVANIENAGGNGGIVYNKDHGRFEDPDGNELSRDDITGMAGAGLGRPAQAGGSTLARHALFQSLLQGEGGQSQRPDGVLESLVEQLRQHDSPDGESPLKELFYSRNDDVDPAGGWMVDPPSKWDDFRHTMQDKHIDTKRVVQAIRKTVSEVADTWDPYLQEELFHGRSAKQVNDFLSDELKPLMQDMQMRGVTMPEFEEYLHMRHAEERNNQISKVNPDMADGGAGVETAAARAYLAGLPESKKRAYEALAKRVDTINRNTRQILIDSGLEAAETVKAWETAYQFYVPLQREESGAGGLGQGFSVRGSSSKRAMGSKRAVVDILANIAMQREKTIVRAEKNRVATALYGLAITAPNKDFWLPVNPEKLPAEKQAELVRLGLNPLDVKNVADEPKQRYVDPRTGLVAERVNPFLRSAPNVLSARVNGEDRYVFFNEDDERAVRMVRSLKNLDADQLGRLLSLSAKVTRFFASINTQYNPIFGIINLFRDVQGSMLNLSTTPIAGKQKEVLANTLSALRGIYIDVRDTRAGKETDSSWAALYEEFQKEGGQTGFRDMFSNSKERAEAIEKEIAKITEGKLKMAGRAIFDWLSDYNTTMENAVRLASYKVAKDQGMTNQQAASLAKNISVNFNRKGQAGTQAGALYAFFNASVQGTARLTETLRGPAGKKIVMGGLLLGSMQAVLLALAGFDDDEPPEFVRSRNLIIPTGGGKYLTIPMPLGFNILPGVSRIATEFVLGGFKNPSKKILHIVDLLADNFNPIGNAGLSLQTIAPTAIDPLAALSENRDWTGKPIAKKDMSQSAPTPGHTRAKDTASEIGKWVAYGLNALSGGTKYKPGIVSPTPDQIDYLIGQVTGGVGREALKLEQTVTSTVTGEDLPPHKIPLVGRFYGDTKGQSAVASKFYDNIKKLNEHEAEVKGRRKDKGDVTGYLRDHPEAMLTGVANQVERDVADLRKRKRELLEKNANKERIKMVEQQIANRMKFLNDRVEKAEKRQ